MKTLIRQWIAYSIMLIGTGFLCGPFILGAVQTHTQAQAVEAFYRDTAAAAPVETLPAATVETTEAPTEAPAEQPTVEESTEPTEETVHLSMEDFGSLNSQAFFQAAYAYNQELQRSQEKLSDSSNFDYYPVNATDYGYRENIGGILEVPRLGVELAIYLGASLPNMEKGACIIGQTSFPLGMANENVAIAGHRGWRGSAMFRDIQQMQLNDPIYVTTPWNTLCYRVRDIQIVEEDDNTWLHIQQGKTQIVLMTCHPYSVYDQRYLVFAELTNESKPEPQVIAAENDASFDPSARQVTQVSLDGTRQTVSVEPVAVEPDGSEYGSAFSNAVILAENKMKPVAIASAIFVGLVGIRLVVTTVSELRSRKRENHAAK